MPHNIATMLPPLGVSLKEFEVSENGFLPGDLPLQRLGDQYYEPWEVIMDRLPCLLQSGLIRREIDTLNVLSTSQLVSQSEWQRAYLILSFFTHSYIWEAGGPSERLPPAISVPFLEVAERLGLPPTATYAALNLYNFTAIDPELPLSEIENLRSLHTFTNSRDEEWFLLVSVAMEARGGEIIPVMLEAMEAVRCDDVMVVIDALLAFRRCVAEVGALLKRMHEHCRPDFFYNQIRPFLAGSKNMAAAGLPNGVFYDEGEGNGEWRQYSGGSNAQSSLIQFWDVVLGVEHSLTGAAKGSKPGFLSEMRNYMPGPHRRFLEQVEAISNIRQYAETSANPAVSEAYNGAIKELATFRDIHIQIVTRYIIMPSRQQSSTSHSGLNLAVASTNGDGKSLQGTGGTELLPFLKQSRDETRDTAL